MSAWLAAAMIAVSAGGLEGARRAWKRRRPCSIEQIGTSLANARVRQSQLPETPVADRAPQLPPEPGGTPILKLHVGARPDAEHRDQAQQDRDVDSGAADGGHEEAKDQQ